MSSAKTPNGATTPYATPADYAARVDVRFTGDLVRDDGTQATATELLADANLAAALADASGMVEAAVLGSERYAVADLQALTGNSQALLKRIVCGLAIQCVRDRRGTIEPSTYPLYTEAVKWLDALHQGRRIFALAETEAAGLPDVSRMLPGDYFNSLPTLLTNNLRQWGIRSNRRCGGDGGGSWGPGPGSWY